MREGPVFDRVARRVHGPLGGQEGRRARALVGARERQGVPRVEDVRAAAARRGRRAQAVAGARALAAAAQHAQGAQLRQEQAPDAALPALARLRAQARGGVAPVRRGDRHAVPQGAARPARARALPGADPPRVRRAVARLRRARAARAVPRVVPVRHRAQARASRRRPSSSRTTGARRA